MTFLQTTHLTAALISLLLGAALLWAAKGTARHVLGGRIWVFGMAVVNGAALSSFEDARFSIFHWLALLSLFTLICGLIAIRRARTIEHAIWMSWTYAGLFAAGIGQLGALLDLPVAPAILGALAVAVILINLRGMPAKAALRLLQGNGPNPD